MKRRGRPTGYKMSEKSKQKTSNSLNGRKLSEEHKQNISTSMIGNESRRKYSVEAGGSGLVLIWHAIRERILNESNKQWLDYGGRGLLMEETWKEDYETFYQDIKNIIGLKPCKEATLDRKDNNVGYLKTNLRWADRTVQCLNRRICNRDPFDEGIFITSKNEWLVVITENNYCRCIARVSSEREAKKIFKEYHGKKV